jgi:beta-mannosidase
MFAGKPYRDDDPAYLASVEAEARHQVRRIRTHPSLAVWCGNNEVQVLAELLQWDDADPGRGLFHELLPRVVAEEDGGTGYLPTSPLPGADRHNWHVWLGVVEPLVPVHPALELDGPVMPEGSPEAQAFVDVAAPESYLEDTSAFASEYGLCGMPTWETLQRWTDPEDLVLGSTSVRRRSSDSRLGPRNKVELLLHGLAGRPTDLRHQVALSHLLQAEGVKVGVEHYRRSWPRCGGSLVWQLDDCWPATSWALVDVEGRAKPVLRFVAAAYAPTLLSFHPDGTLWVTTDVVVEGEVVVRCRGFDGTRHWEESVHVAGGAMTSHPVRRFDRVDPLSTYLSVEGFGVRNRQPFPRPVDLVRPRADVTVDGLVLTADAYALQVQTAAGECFDLEAGESREVTTTEGLYWL